MSRRRPKGELQFGSDSFLDVVANIVGILIILIVIAGLRVSQTPVVLKQATSEVAEPTTLPPPSSLPELEVAPEPTTEPPSTPQIAILEPVEEEPDPPLPEVVAPEDLVNLAKRLEAEIHSIKADDSSHTARLKQSGMEQAALLERQRAIQELLAEKSKELTASKKEAVKREVDLNLAKETLARLTREVQQLESVPDRVETLEHRITPISRVVNGNEKHYRLEKNRVVEVPIEDLVFRFREQLERRKEWIVKTRQQNGEIGPVKGFRLQYVLHVDTYSDLTAARMGHGGYAISLDRWVVTPEPETKGETADAALRKGSQFYQSILGTAPDTTLTFWIYPDSFAIYHKLQKFAHDHGYSVAGRPLPHGQPISGSQHGSASASQ